MLLTPSARLSLLRTATQPSFLRASSSCSPILLLSSSFPRSTFNISSSYRSIPTSSSRRISTSSLLRSDKLNASAPPIAQAGKEVVEGAPVEEVVPPAVEPAGATYPMVIYVGPISKALYYLKAFSLSSLVASSLLSPFIFILEADLGFVGRCFLAGCAISTTITSTALIGWCASPYVSTIELLEPPSKEHPTPAIRLLTYTTLLQPRYTTLTTPLFIHPSTRPMASWQLRPLLTPPTVAFPDTVAQTADKNGVVLGSWDGEGSQELDAGKVRKDFMVHEELLTGLWGMDGWRSRKE